MIQHFMNFIGVIFGMNGLSIKQMIDAGVHFGHRSKYWNPKMEPYIYTTHKKLHIINLEKALKRFNEARNTYKS